MTAEANPITLADVTAATPAAIAALDQNFFRVRFDRLISAERTYMRAMAELGDGPARSGDVAAALGQTTNAAGPVRDSLIRKGVLYSPELGTLGQLSQELGLPFAETEPDRLIEGIYKRPVDLASGRYALIERLHEFSLVPWRPVLEKQLDHYVSGRDVGDSISWTLGRQRGGLSI